MEIIEKINKSADIQEQNYGNKKIRRIVFIQELDKKLIENMRIPEFINFLSEKNILFDKYFTLKFGFENFYGKYPFLCLNEEKDSNDINRLYPFSKFPSEIIEDHLFLVFYFTIKS